MTMGLLDRLMHRGRYQIRVAGKFIYGSDSKYEAKKAHRKALGVEGGFIEFIVDGVTVEVHQDLSDFEEEMMDEDVRIANQAFDNVKAREIMSGREVPAMASTSDME